MLNEETLERINTRSGRNRRAAGVVIVMCPATLGALYISVALAVGVFVLGVLLFWYARRLDRESSKVRLFYTFAGGSGAWFRSIGEACKKLSGVERIWIIEAQDKNPDWKLHAGTTSIISRSRAGVERMNVPEISANVAVWGLDLGENRLFFFPDKILLRQRSGYTALPYETLGVSFSAARYVEERVPKDAEIVGHTWKHVKRDGSPDESYKSNPRIPIVLYGSLKLRVADELDLELQVSDTSAASLFARSLGFAPKRPRRSNTSSKRRGYLAPATMTVESARRVLGVQESDSRTEIVAAYRKLARKFHPDKVVGAAPEIREMAEQRMKEINAAYAMLKQHIA